MLLRVTKLSRTKLRMIYRNMRFQKPKDDLQGVESRKQNYQTAKKQEVAISNKEENQLLD